MIVRSVDGKVIGKMDNGVFVKEVRGSIHMLTSPRGWGIDVEAYNQDIKPHCAEIQVHDMETDLLYTSTARNFDEKKIYINRGFGGQFVLLLKDWSVKSREQLSLL